MPDIQYKNVINRLIYYRKNLGATQKEMAELLGISQSEYCKIENGQGRLLQRHLKTMYSKHWDIDYIVTGKHNMCDTGVLNNILNQCTPEEADLLYGCIIENVFLYWDMLFQEHSNKCLYSEIKIIIVMMANQASQSETLRYIRTVLGMNKKEFGELLDITRKTYSRCEEGTSQLDIEHILKLYNNQICNPSFIVDYRHELLARINYELQSADDNIRNWFYDKISGELKEIRKLKNIISS